MSQTHHEEKFLLTTLRPQAEGWSVKTTLKGGSGLTLLKLGFINSPLKDRFLLTALSFWDMFIKLYNGNPFPMIMYLLIKFLN